MAQFVDAKLAEGDTREALLDTKLRAQMSFLQVSQKYHLEWLNCLDQSRTALQQLETFKSQNLDEKVCQPPAAGVESNTAAYLTWLYLSLKRQTAKFNKLLQDLNKATGVAIECAPLKGKERVQVKAFYDYAGDYSRLLDIARGSAVADDLQGVVRALEWILEQRRTVRMKNRFCDAHRDIMARGGYRDVLINLEFGGFIFELQLHLKPLYLMKEEAHKVLDVARAIIEPALFKLSLLDSRESHALLVLKIQQLERQISSMTIEAAMKAPQPANDESQYKALLHQKDVVIPAMVEHIKNQDAQILDKDQQIIQLQVQVTAQQEIIQQLLGATSEGEAMQLRSVSPTERSPARVYEEEKTSECDVVELDRVMEQKNNDSNPSGCLPLYPEYIPLVHASTPMCASNVQWWESLQFANLTRVGTSAAELRAKGDLEEWGKLVQLAQGEVLILGKDDLSNGKATLTSLRLIESEDVVLKVFRAYKTRDVRLSQVKRVSISKDSLVCELDSGTLRKFFRGWEMSLRIYFFDAIDAYLSHRESVG